jgi:hypothetical protein
MEHFNKKINSHLLKECREYYPYNNNNITKINDEPYSYWIGSVKMYVFDEGEIIAFMSWYWYNKRDSFFFDICNINYEIPYKYFCDKIPDFKINYPTVDEYSNNIIENPECMNIYEEIISVSGGIDNFITNVIIFKNRYKKIGIKKTNNIKYFFATDCGTKIRKN